MWCAYESESLGVELSQNIFLNKLHEQVNNYEWAIQAVEV